MAMKRSAIIIDALSLYHMSRALGAQIDFAKLKARLSEHTPHVTFIYHVAIPPGDEDFTLRPLIDWLTYNGFIVKEKQGRVRNVGGRETTVGNCMVEIAVDLINYAERYKDIVLIASRGDLVAAVAAAQRRGALVTLISTLQGDRPQVSDELRRQADQFVDIVLLKNKITFGERIASSEPEQLDVAS